MKKRYLTICFCITSLLAASCTKKGPAISAETIENNSYRLTANVREDYMQKNEKSVDFTYSKGTEAMPYEVWYGTYGGSTYYKADSETPVVYVDGDVDGMMYEDLWTHEETVVPFEAYTEAFNAFFTEGKLTNASYAGSAELTLETAPNEDAPPAVACDVYHADTTAFISLWDKVIPMHASESVSDDEAAPEGAEGSVSDGSVSDDETETLTEAPVDVSYTAMSTDIYVSGGKALYAVMEFSGTEGYNMTITATFGKNIPEGVAVADEEVFQTYEVYRNRQMGIAMNDENETAFDIMDISQEDIANKTADGFYYADGTYTYSHPENSQSWQHLVGGVVVEEFDREKNVYANHETGETIEDVVTVVTEVDENGNEYTYEEQNNIYGEESLGASAEDLEDVYDLPLNSVQSYVSVGKVNGVETSWEYIIGYSGHKAEADAHPELVPESIRTKAEDIYNRWTLQQIIDKIKGNKLSEDEKYIIAYIATDQNFTISSSTMASISLKELITASGLNVDAYYDNIVACKGPWIPGFMASAYAGSPKADDTKEQAE